MARWANFFAEMPLEGLCWASFFAELLRNGALGEFFAEVRAEAPCGASLWLLDAGLVPPPTSRACHRPYISGIPPVVVARGRLRWARINRLSAGFQLFRRNGSQPLYL